MDNKPTYLFVPKQSLSDIGLLAKKQQSSRDPLVPNGAKPVKKNSRIVLNEDEYVESLERIIERDFFPDLKKLRANAQYLDALESGDASKMKEIALDYARTTDLGHGSSSSSQPGLSEKMEKDITENLSLDRFLSKYTSEDNASFTQIIDKQNEQRKRKYNMLHRDRLKELEGPPDKLQITAQEEQRKLEAPVRNALMYIPQGVGSMLKETDLRGDKKAILYNNTRISSSETSQNAKTTAESRHNIVGSEQALLRLRAIRQFTPSASNANANDSPHINGYSFVAVTPSPVPDSGGATPILTWGEIESTPLLLEPVDVGPLDLHTSGPEFKMPELADREKLGKRLGDKATMDISRRGNQRATKQSQSSTSGIGGSALNDQKFRMLSPAAQNLLLSKSQKSPWMQPIAKKASTPNSSYVRRQTPSPFDAKSK